MQQYSLIGLYKLLIGLYKLLNNYKIGVILVFYEDVCIADL